MRTRCFFSLGALLGLAAAAAMGAPEVEVAGALGDQVEPAIAFNALRSEYLVVWVDNPSGVPQIHARRMLSGGAAAAPAFVVAGGDATARYAPDVAYNSDLGQFLVVWEQEYSSSDHDIYAQRLAGDGTPVGAAVPVAVPPTWESLPSVAYNPITEQYLVAWVVRPDVMSYGNVRTVRLTGEGVPVGAPADVSAGAFEDTEPDVVCLWSSNTSYLVVWQSQSEAGDFDIKARRVASDGAVLGVESILARADFDQLYPRACYNPLSDEALVVWQDHRWGWGWDRDIYGQRVGSDGGKIAGNFAVSWEDFGADDDRWSPDVTADGAGRYLVTWGYDDADEGTVTPSYVGFRWLSADGALLGQETVFAPTAAHPVRPAVAMASPDHGFVVWEDDRIYHLRLRDLFASLLTRTPPELITFEEKIAAPSMVTDQYCSHPVLSKGVQFPHGGRIVDSPTSTITPKGILHNNFGTELDETRTLPIVFTLGQSMVGMRVGTIADYPFPVTATLHAYRSPTPGVDYIGSASVLLGSGFVVITNPVSVTSVHADIRSVVLECRGPNPGDFAFESIDNLSFSRAGPPCMLDASLPSVTITYPAADSMPVFESSRLAFEARDDELGIASVEVRLLNQARAVLTKFSACGAPGVPPCPIPGHLVRYDFMTQFPAGVRYIQVRAWDYAGHEGVAERSVYLDPLGPDLNVFVMGMEVTQAIQPWVPRLPATRLSGPPLSFTYPDAPVGVPFVSNRTTVVRLYAGVEGIGPSQRVEQVTAVLRAFRDAEFRNPVAGIHTLLPVNGPATLSPTNTFEGLRDNVEDTFTFVLPVSWTQGGTIHLEAEITASGMSREQPAMVDAANAIRIARLKFAKVPAFELLHRVYGVRLTMNGNLMLPNPEHVRSAMDFIRKVYPLDESTVPSALSLEWTYVDEADPSVRGPVLLGAFHGAFAAFAQGKHLAYAAAVPNLFPAAGLGVPQFCFWQLGPTAHAIKAAPHEIGHAWGLNHCGPAPGHGAECQGGWCDGDWPWPHGTYPGYGFDILDLKPIAPGLATNSNHDLMSYGGKAPNWISSRNWIRLFNAMTQTSLAYPYAGDQISYASVQNESLTSYFLVRGQRSESGVWTLQPIYEMEESAQVESRGPEAGLYAIELRDRAGRTLLAHGFAVAEDVHVDLEPGVGIAAPLSFTELVPTVAGAVQVVLLSPARQVVAQATRSATAPSLSITSPDASGFLVDEGPVVEWAALDPDPASALRAMILYAPGPRPDGSFPWQSLALDVAGSALPVNLLSLPGGDAARVRLYVTDGLNTAVATSPAFVVADKPPHLDILHPSQPTTVRRGETVLLRASGTDVEDGVLPGGNLFWGSSLDGVLGSGASLPAAFQTEGVHLLSVAGMDSHGQIGIAKTSITVAGRMNHQPVAQAGPDQATAPSTALALSGEASSDLDGDPLAFTWSMQFSPAGSRPFLSHADTATPTFSSPDPGVYVIGLVVHDGVLASAMDVVVVEVTDANVAVQVADGPHGSAVPGGHLIVPAGAALEVDIAAERYYHVAAVYTNGVPVEGLAGGWSYRYAWTGLRDGDVLFAEFAPNRTRRGTPEAWLAEHGHTNDVFDLEEMTDRDDDGAPAWMEYQADTLPGDATSRLSFLAMRLESSRPLLTWKGGREARQYLERCLALDTPFAPPPLWVPVFTNQPPTPVTNSAPDATALPGAAAYRLRAMRP